MKKSVTYQFLTEKSVETNIQFKKLFLTYMKNNGESVCKITEIKQLHSFFQKE